MNDVIQPQLEWEPLTRTKEIRWKFKLPSPNPVGEGMTEIEVHRNSRWEVEAVARGTRVPVVRNDDEDDPRQGEAVLTFPIEAQGFSGQLRISDASLSHLHVDGNLRCTRELHVFGAAEIVVGERADALARARRGVLWCINGTDHSIPFDICTSRTLKTEHTRTRDGFPDREVIDDGNFNDSVDALDVPAPGFGLLPAVLAKVPSEIAIDHAVRPAAIEFTVQSVGDVPSRQEVDVYVAALSFALGRRLVPVGLSYYDENNMECLHALRSSWAFDVQSDCTDASEPPTEITREAIAYLVPAFLARIDEYKLKDALWHIWMADSMSVENQLSTLASAFDGIVNAWFKSTKTKTQGKYLPDAEWEADSREALKLLEPALKGKANAERILRKVANANNLGMNEKSDQFFVEINLPIGKVEKAAIKHRNRATHGGSFGATEYRALINTIAAYRTMLMRVILRLLDWSGEYVDRSTYGFPSRSLNEACGGPEGDGEPADL